MDYALMHKRIPVAHIELDEATGSIYKINKVLAPEHLPVGVPLRKGTADRTALNSWWTDRSIPTSRSGIREALETLNISSPKMLLARCYGLSLSDQYWIKPSGCGLSWEDINFFDNAFSDDIGDVLFGHPPKGLHLDLRSPDNTSDGCLKKRWKIINGKRCLIKGGSNPFRQQPFNEAIATGIMERLNIPHIPYTVIWDDGSPYSVCEDFVTSDTDLVSAWRIMQIKKKENNTSVYQHFIHCCNTLGAPDIRQALDQMLVLDYLIANEDRHLNNFGLLRNAETLEWIGYAPIYDSGSSLGYDKTAAQILAEKDILCKPFKKHHIEQIKLVTSFHWLDLTKLSDHRELISGILSTDSAKDFIDDHRKEAILSSVKKRILALEKMAADSTKKKYQMTTQDDVERNIAEDYTKNKDPQKMLP